MEIGLVSDIEFVFIAFTTRGRDLGLTSSRKAESQCRRSSRSVNLKLFYGTVGGIP
jgi:uncharacterized DUF497 family protein